jgi:hypothetical protein
MFENKMSGTTISFFGTVLGSVLGSFLGNFFFWVILGGVK